MPKSSDIHYLIIHTSDSAWGSVEAIREWHTLAPPNGRGWADIGYHYVILNGFTTYKSLKDGNPDTGLDGAVKPGRDIDHDCDIDEEIGAHCPGYNTNSLGICLVGVHGKYTAKQIESLYSFCRTLMSKYNIPVGNVLGHYETQNGKAQGKTCPNLNMDDVRAHL